MFYNKQKPKTIQYSKYKDQKHPPIKKRNVRANQAPFINSKIHKEIMKRTCLRNKFIDAKPDADRITYNGKRPIRAILKYVT